MTQLTQTLGEGVVAVQIAGDANTVQIIRAGATLALDRLHARKRDPKSLIELLLTDARATTLVGRAAELADLAAWRASEAAVAVRCITGGAGTGKTRLAIEACEAAERDGWVAAFVRSDELARFHATQNLVHWVLPQDVLIVVDYAATSLAVLKAWFGLLAAGGRAGRKLRILLLERQAEAASGWWADLLRRDSATSAGPADLVRGERPIPLPPLDGRRALLTETMRLAAPLLGPATAIHVPPEPGANPSFDAAIARASIDNEPLYLMMAGVHAAKHGIVAALELSGPALAHEMATIEAARLTRFAASRGYADGGALLNHLAACLTLQNGAPLDALEALVAEEMAAMRMTAPHAPARIAEHLLDALPTNVDAVAPIRPDLIGEAFLLPAIRGGRLRGWEQQRAIVFRAYARAPDGTVDSLVRTARDFAEGDANHLSVRSLCAVVEISDSVMQLLRIALSMPESTLALREVATDVESRILSLVRSLDLDGPERDQLLASSLNNVANRLSALGRPEEALTAAEKAVGLYHALAASWPDAFTPALAMSLNNVAIMLGNLGRREDALAAAKEAVRLRRALAASRRDVFTSALATSLVNAAVRLSALGLREDALAAAQEAVELYRALAASRSDAFAPDLAMSLNNVAKYLSDLGRREDALAAAEEAVRLYRALAASGPDAFTPDLAMSLNTIAKTFSSLGRREDALAAAEGAVRLYRALAASRPDAFKHDVAMSLNTTAVTLSELGRREDALAAAEEAVRLYRALTKSRPDAFTPDLAGSLNTVAVVLSELGRREAAFAAADEAVRLYRALAASRSDAFTPDLAGSLNNIANRLSELGRREDALTVSEEAVQLYRALAASRPDAFTPDLAGSLSNVSVMLSEFGRREDALAAAQEAVRLRRALAASRPDVFTPDLAGSLNNLANRLCTLGQREDALAAAHEAVRLYRALAASRPEAFSPGLAMSLNTVAAMLSALGQREDTLAAAEEAVQLYRALATSRPDAFTPGLAISLNNVASWLSALGRREDALAAAEEAVRLRRALAASRPDAFTPDLATSLSVLGDVLEAAERIPESIASDRDALQALTPYFLQHPTALGSRIVAYAQNYVRRCERNGTEPDDDLLEPIVAKLQSLE